MLKNRVIQVSKLWAATFFLGVGLTGCGGAGASSERSAVLSWSAPLTRVNGESISMGELDRYVIRYGQDAGELSQEVVIPNAQVEAEMSYELRGLDVGTWYFTIEVQDINGLISEPSDVVSKSIRS
ncbi:fibronectin type III domain-containing protein [Marinobacter sp. F3R08]|uniref:fibronectin type III domain-containing protein n=1 Tax=Marinobacter sp. F3R08 TaxID=2841559 RepID=UPI001E3F7ED3|nr:fibronectin type III domain-containing protein [Marinobacter sp. F3R08]